MAGLAQVIWAIKFRRGVPLYDIAAIFAQKSNELLVALTYSSV